VGVTNPCASQKPERQPTKGPMKEISDLFTDEEKKQLSYLGSMLHQEPTEEEQEQQRILDAWADAKSEGPNAQQKVFEGEEGE
jgi:hypothetical protein